MGKIKQLHEMQQNAAHFELDRWLMSGVFIPWIILFKLIDRKRAHSIWFYGLMVLIITSFTDDLGSEIGSTELGLRIIKNGHGLNEQIDRTLQKSEKPQYTLKLTHQPEFISNMYRAKTEGTNSKKGRGNREDIGPSRSS